jgi:hypothetical protein
MTQPTLTPGTQVEIRPGAASAWGRRFPAGGQATVLGIAVDDDLVGQEIYVLPDGDPSHNTLRLRVEDLTPIDPGTSDLELTPALQRAAAVLQREGGDVVIPVTIKMLSAALDAVELGQVVHEHRPYYLRSGRGSCCCGWTFEPVWDGTRSSERRTSARKAFATHQGDAIRAKLLGGSS